jgi:hypothetical protein
MESNAVLSSIPDVHVPIRHAVFGTDESILLCPVCGVSFVHIANVEVKQGHVSLAATHDQVQIQPSTRHQGHKGSQVTLSCFCENSHWFEYELRFEKGNTFIALSTGKLEDRLDVPELWRN